MVSLRKIQKAVVEYHKAQGCGCCSDYDERKKAERKLGKLLGFPAYKDGSGYNLYHLPEKPENDDVN